MNDQNKETQEEVSVEQEESKQQECELCGETEDVTIYEYGIRLGLCEEECHAVCKECKEENTIEDSDYSFMHPNETQEEFYDHED
ncbi:MAG: hypothetical protein U9Q15_01675 [Patescibacteria group bacterium]|nr:hypothetical protein [Patescibacteria group bacterium]